MAPLLVCSVCGDRVGVYERLAIVDAAGRIRTTSLAREPELRHDGMLLLHEHCAERLSHDEGAEPR